MTDKLPKRAYASHKNSAKQRGIAFTLSFEQWWELWEPHWERRGRGINDMCMCRRHDQGGYELGNVRIATVRENRHEAAMERKVRHSQRRHSSREYRTPLGLYQAGWISGHYKKDEEDEETC